MAGTCDTDERWPHSKRPFIWRTGQALGINTDSWEVTATDRDAWRHTVKVGLSQYEETQWVRAEEKRLHKKTVCLASRPTTAFTCSKGGRDCHCRIGLESHNRCCTMGVNLWSFDTDRCQWYYLVSHYPVEWRSYLVVVTGNLPYAQQHSAWGHV